jgi:hypothetical protein
LRVKTGLQTVDGTKSVLASLPAGLIFSLQRVKKTFQSRFLVSVALNQVA